MKILFRRLNLPGEVGEDGSKSKYEVESGNYIIHAKKVQTGQHFEDLDLLTTLLTTKTSGDVKSTPLIEVIDSNGSGKSYICILYVMLGRGSLSIVSLYASILI